MGQLVSADNKAVNINATSSVSKDFVDILNKNMNSVTANTIISAEQNCIGTNIISQKIDFSKCRLKDSKINISGSDNAKIEVNFKCIQVPKTSTHIGQALLSEMMAELQKSFSVKSLNDMNTKAKAEASASGLFAPGSNASNSVHNIYELSTVSDNYTEIQNVIANEINTTLNVESIQNCINSNAVQQLFDMSSCELSDGSEVNYDRSRSSEINGILDCVNSSETVNSTVQNIINQLGIKVESKTAVDSESKMVNDLTAAAKSIGIDPTCGSCPLPGCGNQMWCCSWSCCICIVLLIILGLCWWFFFKNNGGGTLNYGMMELPMNSPPMSPPGMSNSQMSMGSLMTNSQNPLFGQLRQAASQFAPVMNQLGQAASQFAPSVSRGFAPNPGIVQTPGVSRGFVPSPSMGLSSVPSPSQGQNMSHRGSFY
jgi:hypothetical protein